MKRIFFITDTTENQISYYHLAGFLAVLPFDFFYSEIILISFGLHTLLHAKRDDLKNLFQKPVLLLTSLYWLSLMAMLYSPDIPEAIVVATRQLAILIFPVLFAISHADLKKYTLNLVCIFGFSCTLTILYLYVDAWRTLLYYNLPVSSLFKLAFMNHNFSIPVGIHATYLSMYTAFSLIAFLYLVLTNPETKPRWIYILASVILFAGLLQLSSRAVFIAFLIIVNLAFPFILFQGRKRLLLFLMTSVLSAGLFIVISQVESFKTRYISELKVDLTDHVKIIENTEPRLARWDAILELIRKSPFIGYGSGSEKKLLKEKYFEKGLYNSYLNEFNAHNEYLSLWLKTGITGLLLFLCLLFVGLASAIRKKDILLLSFLLIIATVSLSENVLDLNKGIFFYSFFFSLLWVKAKPVTGKNSMESIGKTGNPGKRFFVYITEKNR